MSATDQPEEQTKALLRIPLPQEPEELFDHIGKLLARLDTLKGNREETEEEEREAKNRYLNAFKTSKDDLSTFEEFQLKILQGLSKLFLISYKIDFFWYDCPTPVYKKTFEKRLRELNKYDPELTENEQLIKDYRAFDVIPLHGQRFLRTDIKYIGLDYGELLEKRVQNVDSNDNSFLARNPILVQEAEDLYYKLERARKEKMDIIQKHFQSQGTMIIKNGTEYLLIDLPTPVKTVEVPSPHGHIFANNGNKLFNFLMEKYIQFDKKGWKSMLAYFYRRLKEDGFIHCNITEFQNWFNSTYKEEPGQLKTTSNISEGTKKQNYDDALDWLKNQ